MVLILCLSHLYRFPPRATPQSLISLFRLTLVGPFPSCFSLFLFSLTKSLLSLLSVFQIQFKRHRFPIRLSFWTLIRRYHSLLNSLLALLTKTTYFPYAHRTRSLSFHSFEFTQFTLVLWLNNFVLPEFYPTHQVNYQQQDDKIHQTQVLWT